MTVQELIDKLRQCSPNKLVHVWNWKDYEMTKDVAEYEDIIEILHFN